MKIVNYVVTVIFCCVLAACGSDEEPTGVISEHQLKAMEKAQGVEAMLQEADEKRRKQMEEDGI